MTRLFLSTLLLTMLAGTAFSQGWVRTYGGPEVEYAYSIVATADGGFMTAGTQTDSIAGEHFWVARFDSAGDKKWDHRYGDTGVAETIFSFSRTHDDGFMVGGFTGQQFSGTESAVMYRGDSTGKNVWKVEVDYNRSDHFHFGFERKEGGYYFGGHTDSKGDPSGDMWLVKYDSLRNVVWEKTYDRGSGEHAHTGIETPDGGCLLVGHTDMNGLEKYWVVKVDSNGTLQWQKPFSSQAGYHDSPYKVFMTKEGNYGIVGGSSSAAQSSLSRVWLLVIDGNGEIVIDKHFGNPAGESFAWSGQQTSDGGYIVAGYTKYKTKGQEDLYVVKAKADGSLDWEKTYGGDGVDYGFDVIEVKDGYVACGYTSTPSLLTGGDVDLLLVKIPKESLPLPASVTLLYPTPGTSVASAAVSFSWNVASPSVTGYELTVSTDSLFAQSVVDTTVSDTGTGHIALQSGSSYWWHVRARNASGWGPYSETRRFVVVESTIGVPVADASNVLRLDPIGVTAGEGVIPIRFSVPGGGSARLSLYDLTGREVSLLEQGQLPAGRYSRLLDTRSLPAGVYLCRLVTSSPNGEEHRVQRIYIIR